MFAVKEVKDNKKKIQFLEFSLVKISLLFLKNILYLDQKF